MHEHKMEQEIIPVWCTPPSCTNLTFFNSNQVSALVVGSWSDQVWKVSIDCHQMSLAGVPCTVRSHVWRGLGLGGLWTVRSNASWVMVTRNSVVDKHDWKHYLPATLLAGGNHHHFLRVWSFRFLETRSPDVAFWSHRPQPVVLGSSCSSWYPTQGMHCVL